MPQAIGFEQDPEAPPGAGMFHFDTGQSVYAHDPYLASNLGAPPAPAPDQRLAEAGPIPPGVRAAMGLPEPEQRSDARTPTFDPSVAHGAPPAPANPEQLPERFVTQPVKAPQPKPPTPYEPGIAGMGSVRLPDQPQSAAPAGEAPRFIPGSRGGVVPTSKTVETEAQGAPYSPEDAQRRAELDNAAVGAQLADFARQKEMADRDALKAGIQAAHLRDVAEQKAADVAQREENYRRERAHFDTEQQEFDRNARVDPNRWFHQKGTFANIGLAVAQALGAYSAAINHTSNPVQGIIDNAIQRDIAAQEEELRQGRIGQNNALARLKDQYGDLDQARAALSMLQQKAVDNEIQSIAKFDQSKQTQSAAQIWLAQNAQRRQLEEQKFRDIAIGKRTEKVNLKVVPSSGGRYETEEEQLKRQARIAGYKADIAKSGAVVQAGGLDPNRAGKAAGIPRGLQNRYVSAANVLQAAAQLGESMGIPKEKDGTFTEDWSSATGGSIAERIKKPLAKPAAVNASIEIVVPEVLKVLSGGVATQEQLKHETEAVKAMSPQAQAIWLNRHIASVKHTLHIMEQVGQGTAEADGGEHGEEGDVGAY